MQLGFFFDQSRCVGCLTCVIACQEWHQVPAGPVAWRRVITLHEGRYPDPWMAHLSLACNHCEAPPCLDACPAGAITKRADNGVVVVDRSVCIPNCQACLAACPYGAPQFEREADARMQKCDFCLDRLAEGKQPLCVAACPLRALDAGPLDALRRHHGSCCEAPGLPDPAGSRPALVVKPRPRTVSAPRGSGEAPT